MSFLKKVLQLLWQFAGLGYNNRLRPTGSHGRMLVI